MFCDPGKAVLRTATLRWLLGILSCVLILFASASAQVTVSVYPSATDTVFGGAVRSLYANVCAGTNAIGCTRPSDITTTWSADGGTLSAATGAYVKWTAPSTPGTYTVSATSNGVSATRQFNVIADSVTVNLVPFYLVLYQNQYALLQPIVMGSTDQAVTWETSGGTLTSTPRTASFSSSAPGTYTIRATSQADASKSAITTIVVTANPMPATATPQHTEPVDCTHVGDGTDYEVNSNADLDTVPWKSLKPGDTIRIHNNGEPYTRQFILGVTGGTQTQPIRLCGVPDANGDLPLLSGSGAAAVSAFSTTSDWAGSVAQGGLQNLGVVHVFDKPHAASNRSLSNGYFMIEGLRIGQDIDPTYAGALGGYQFYPVESPATPTSFSRAASSLRVQYTHDLVVRGNELFEGGNGLFTNDQPYVGANTAYLLVEGNYIHNNGSTAASQTQHEAYLQGIGLVVQGNTVGPSRPGATGGLLLLRAAGGYVRYNHVSGGPGYLLGFFETQNIDWNGTYSFTWTPEYGTGNPLSLSQVAANEEAIRSQDYVYGNSFHMTTTTILMDYYSTGGANYCHDGTLWFYHNSVNVDLSISSWSAVGFKMTNGCTFNPSSYPYAELVNNAFWLKQGTPGKQVPYWYWNGSTDSRIQIDKNWIAESWCTASNQANCGSSTSTAVGTGVRFSSYARTYQTGNDFIHVSGTSNLVTGSVAPFDLTTYTPADNSPLLNAAAPLPASVSDLAPTFQYSPGTELMLPRPGTDTLGAMEALSAP